MRVLTEASHVRQHHQQTTEACGEPGQRGKEQRQAEVAPPALGGGVWHNATRQAWAAEADKGCVGDHDACQGGGLP